MSAYRPPEKSLLQKLSENLFVQLGLVLFIGIIAVYMVTKNQKESFWSRVEFLRGSSTQISQTRDANQFASLDSEEQVAQQVLEEAATDPTTAVATRNSAPQAKIYYLEIPQAVLSKWLEEGILTRVETSDEITIGYIPQLAAALEQYKAQIKVLKQDSFQYNLNQLYTAKLENPAPTAPASPQANNGSRVVANTVPGQDLPAFTAYATLDDDRNETLSGQLEISVNPQSSFPAHFEMSPDQSFFISGFARTRSLPERSAASETVVVFKIDR